MSLVGGAGAGGTGGGPGGGGRDNKLKKKIDDTPFAADDDDDAEDEPVFPDIGTAEDDVPTADDNASRSGIGAGVVQYRGVRRYAAGDGSYRTTYVSCINNRDSPHNNRQIWLGRYYDVRAAAMAYDVFSFFNHHETFVNFPELLHLYAQVVPRRGLLDDGTFVPITASDLERIKHIGLGVIRAFYPDSCAAIHTRRNQKALPAGNPGLTAQQRQTAAALQAVYHAQIEDRTRNHVLAFIANQQPLALQFAGQAAPSSMQGSENTAHSALPLMHAANLDLSSVQIPSNVASHAPTQGTYIDFSAIQVPQSHASIPLVASNYSGPRIEDVRQAPARIGDIRKAPTSPDTLRQTSSQHTDSSNTPSYPYSTLFAQSPFAEFTSLSQVPPKALHDASVFRRYGSSPDITTTQAGHLSRPAPTRALSSPESSFLRSLGLIRDPAPPQERPLNTLIRSNMERGMKEEGVARRVSFEEDPYSKAAEARLYAERLRAERLSNEAVATEPVGASSFPLVQRLVELSRTPSQRMDNSPSGSRASPKKQRSSEPLLGAHADLLHSLRPEHGLQSRLSAFSSYKAIDNVQGGSSSPNPGVPYAIPIRAHQHSDHALQEEDQRIVQLRRQAPEELELFGIFKQASAAAEMATNTRVPSTSNVQAASSSTSFPLRLAEQEGATSSRPISTELTLARGEQLAMGPPFVRAPLVPDLNVRAPEAVAIEEALKGVSTYTSAENPQEVAPMNIRELQRLSTLIGPSSQEEEQGRSPPAPHITQPDKSMQEEEKDKGKEKAKDQ